MELHKNKLIICSGTRAAALKFLFFKYFPLLPQQVSGFIAQRNTYFGMSHSLSTSLFTLRWKTATLGQTLTGQKLLNRGEVTALLLAFSLLSFTISQKSESKAV